jgi:hypothetical protein
MRLLLDPEQKSNETRRRRSDSSALLRENRSSLPDLQRAGNQAIQDLFRSSLLQPKLTVGDIDDPAEREADAVATRVIGAPAGSKTSGLSNQEQSFFQRHPARQDSSSSVPGIVEQVLHSAGRPLDPATRAFFEPRLGQDLRHVRVHTDQSASDSAQSIHALAYTAGRDIAFARGRYSPHTEEGKRLLAHELVHTVQQASRGSSVVQRTPDLGIVGIHVVNGKTFAPIRGANVHIDQAGVSGLKSIDLVTDSNGDTTSIQLDDGNYTITVTFWCCDTKVFTVHVDGNAFNFITAMMQNCACRISSNDQDGGGAVANIASNASDGASADTTDGGAVSAAKLKA